MLNPKQIQEIREHLEKAQNPLFLFDNDIDGLSAFLLLRRYIDRGKGTAIKSFPALNSSYIRKIEELNSDYVFVLDKPEIEEAFFKEIWQKNIPLVWIDHHDVSPKIKPENYYNPMHNEKKSSEPTSYLCYKITEKKEDLWLGLLGCVGDAYLPEFYKEFKEKYPELAGDCNTAFDVLYTTEIGKISRIINFGLKDRTSNVLKMIRFLIKVKSPHEILEESSETKPLFKRFSQINSKYQKLLSKAQSIDSSKLLYFQYGGELSLSSDISNELIYKYPKRIICVAYIKGTKANVSLRGEGIRKITLEAIKDIEGATGGGHEQATGCQVPIEELPRFKENLVRLIKN